MKDNLKHDVKTGKGRTRLESFLANGGESFSRAAGGAAILGVLLLATTPALARGGHGGGHGHSSGFHLSSGGFHLPSWNVFGGHPSVAVPSHAEPVFETASVKEPGSPAHEVEENTGSWWPSMSWFRWHSGSHSAGPMDVAKDTLKDVGDLKALDDDIAVRKAKLGLALLELDKLEKNAAVPYVAYVKTGHERMEIVAGFAQDATDSVKEIQKYETVSIHVSDRTASSANTVNQKSDIDSAATIAQGRAAVDKAGDYKEIRDDLQKRRDVLKRAMVELDGMRTAILESDLSPEDHHVGVLKAINFYVDDVEASVTGMQTYMPGR